MNITVGVTIDVVIGETIKTVFVKIQHEITAKRL